MLNLSVSFKANGEPAPCILKEVHLNLPLGAGGFIEIVDSSYILLVNPPLQLIENGARSQL